MRDPERPHPMLLLPAVRPLLVPLQSAPKMFLVWTQQEFLEDDNGISFLAKCCNSSSYRVYDRAKKELHQRKLNNDDSKVPSGSQFISKTFSSGQSYAAAAKNRVIKCHN